MGWERWGGPRVGIPIEEDWWKGRRREQPLGRVARAIIILGG